MNDLRDALAAEPSEIAQKREGGGIETMTSQGSAHGRFARSSKPRCDGWSVSLRSAGYFAVGTGWPVDKIWATDGYGQDANLPTHFESRELNFGGALGIVRYHQFGSPVRLYVDAGRHITIYGDANIAGEILAVAVGHLEPM